VPSREPPDRFPVSFYIVAMLFIMFDIEIIFLYPYAVEAGRAR
jgi:NADH-quinone oxidoreductase subunit A